MEEGYRIENNVIYMPDFSHQPDPRGVGWVYFENMLKYKDCVAQIDGLTGEEDTFGALLQRCVRAAIGLKKLGVEYGDIISVCTYNHFDSCVPHISSMFVGTKIAALDPSLSLRHATHLFKIATPKVVFSDLGSVKLIEDVIKETGRKATIIVFGETTKYLSFSQFAEVTPDEVDFKPVTVKSIHDVPVIMFSSGTTGWPKGICHTHFSMLRAAPDVMKLGDNDKLMFVTDSPYWNAFLFYLHHTIFHGTTRVIYSKFDFKNTWQVFNHKVTTARLNTTELMMICNTPKPASIDTNEIKLLVTGGSPVTVEHVTKAKDVFPNALIRVNYGQSEVFPNILCFDVTNPKHLELLRKKPNACGLPKVGISYKIVDIKTGETLGPNQKGELLIKTELQFSGYYRMDSSDAWDEDGWLKTGDYGYYDEDYCFYIVDRIKEMFKYQYWHIVPAMLEAILIMHPDVVRAIVIGKPHEIDEHHPMAVVQLKKGSNANETEIRQFLDERVEDRERLRGGVKFVENYPMTPSRKVNRFLLKQMVNEGLI